MIGDDLWADVAGAQRAGLAGWLVRTGKFRQDVLAGEYPNDAEAYHWPAARRERFENEATRPS